MISLIYICRGCGDNRGTKKYRLPRSLWFKHSGRIMKISVPAFATECCAADS